MVAERSGDRVSQGLEVVVVRIATTADVLRVSLKKVNILSIELDEALDEAGFRHVADHVGSG